MEVRGALASPAHALLARGGGAGRCPRSLTSEPKSGFRHRLQVGARVQRGAGVHVGRSRGVAGRHRLDWWLASGRPGWMRPPPAKGDNVKKHATDGLDSTL